MLVSFPAGALADRVGVRGTLVGGQTLVAAGLAAAALAGGYGLLLAGVVAAGLAYGAVNPTSTKGVLVWFAPGSRATVVGIKQAGFPVGGALGAFLLPALAQHLGWRGALGAAALLVGGTALVCGLGYREPPRAVAPGGAAPPLSAVLRSRPIWLVSLATLLFALVQVAWIGYTPLYLTEVLGFSVVGAGLVLGQAQVAGAVGRVLCGVVSDRLLGGHRLAVLGAAGVGTAIVCGAMAALGPTSPGAVVALVAVAFGLFGIGWNGIHQTLLAELAGREQMATAVGLSLALASVGAIAGAPLFGYLVDRLGGYRWGWGALAAAMGLALVLLAGVSEPAPGRGAPGASR
jgi:predicted MFS family arabinose efflux permease